MTTSKLACGLVIALVVAASVQGQNPDNRPVESGCIACHAGIEAIRDPASGMMRAILAMGRAAGDPAGCVICHGGDPLAETEELAHGGEAFYPDPGSPWINEHTCGPCHSDHVRVQWNALMMTESGKIQGTAWAFGSLEGYEHRWGNYDAKNPEDPGERLGTEAYRAYMQNLSELEPGAFPAAQVTIPEAPTDLSILTENPEQAAFTYHRTECQRCHWAVKGRYERGDYRGMGCSACHIPYGNEGHYEGGDQTIPRSESGHSLVHAIQSTRKSKVTVHGTTYSGIPVETCTTCHDRGKRIGVTFQGLMESAFTSPSTEGGGGQLPLHTKHYLAMQTDVHSKEGMLCQDCHTSYDVHGDGFLAGTNLAQIQIECADCHGTPEHYPWELPLGWGDEFKTPPRTGPPRGVASTLPAPLSDGTQYPPEDGYLLSARGNPFPEVVRRGDLVIVHTAAGKDLELKPLKLLDIEGELETEAEVAMDAVHLHMDKMECYACHGTWIPQCYGCHLRIDYSDNNSNFDWVAAGHKHAEPEHQADRGERGYDTLVPGKVTEQRSYMRWEEPALAVNGEHRISPVTPGCHPSVTIIGPDGDTILQNHIFRTAPGTEGAGPEGQLGIDHSPGQPHTTGRARSCESCHLSEKALGYGIGGGRLNRPWNEATVVDLMTADGKVLPRGARNQIERIEGLTADWSRFVTEDGRQLQTVGHHFTGSRPLNNKERANTNRQGVCLACHVEIPTESLAVSFLHHVAKYTDALPKDPEQHAGLIHKILLFSAWGQTGGAIGTPLAILVIIIWLTLRRRRLAAGAVTPTGTAGTAGGDASPPTGRADDSSP